MSLFGLNRRRSDTLILAIAQLVLIAYLFQIAAFDHWGDGAGRHAPAIDVAGVAGSEEHVRLHHDHCHGGPSSCADGSSGTGYLSPGQGAYPLPSSPPALELTAQYATVQPLNARAAVLTEPPQT